MTTPNEALREALKPFAEIDLAKFAELVLRARVALSQPMPEAAPHWCTYCNGVNSHNCQFNTALPRTQVYATSNTTASPAAPVTEKPEHAGERVEPEVVWLAKDHAGQLFIVLGDGPHDVYGGEKYITLQYHHEALLQAGRDAQAVTAVCFAKDEAIAEHRAALDACVRALEDAMSYCGVGWVEEKCNAAIRQANEARGSREGEWDE